MAILGLLSIVQFLFLPGLVALQIKKNNLQKIDILILSVPLSAVINFYLVYSLVLFELYTQSVILFIVLLELICLVLLTQFRKSNETPSLDKITYLKFRIDALNIFTAFFFALYVCQFINQIGSVFTQGDAVLSWNAWGVSWSENVIPSGISWYPQLLPANYSLTYVLMGNKEVEIAAKIAVSFYPMIVFAIIFRLTMLFPADRKKILWSGIIFFLIVRTLWGLENTVNGYADFPLSFFVIAIIFVFLLKFNNNSYENNTESTLLTSLLIALAIGAGLVKQSGVYIAAFCPVAWLFLFFPEKNIKEHLKQFVYIGLTILSGLAVWYLYQYHRISTGVSTSNHEYLARIVQLTWDESIIYGITGLNRKLSILWMIFMLFSIFNKITRYITILITIPYILIWAAFVPYDYRNLAPVIPLMSLSIVYGFIALISFLSHFFFSKFDLIWIKKISITLILIGLGIFLSTPKNDLELIKLSNKGKEAIGGELTARLIHFFEIFPENALVATPSNGMGLVPVLKNRYKPMGCGTKIDEMPIGELVHDLNSSPDIKYVLIFEWCDQKILNYFEENSNEYKKIFKFENALFYKINNK